MELKNVSLGLGNLEFGSYANDVFQSYRAVGAIKSEVTLAFMREILPFETGRPLRTVIQEVIRETIQVTATLAEMSLATIKDALGTGNLYNSSMPTFLDGTNTAPYGDGVVETLTAVTSGTLLKVGGSPTHSYIGLRFTHRRRDNVRVIFEGFKASPSGELTVPFQEADYNVYQVQFNLLADVCRPSGEQYCQMFIEQFTPSPAC